VGDGEKLLTHLNSALKVLLGLDIFPLVAKKKLNFVDQCNWSHRNSNKGFKEINVETIPRKHSVVSLQKTAILGTSHIIRKVLQCEA